MAIAERHNAHSGFGSRDERSTRCANSACCATERRGITFWWTGSRTQLLEANRHIVLKGPGGKKVDVHYHDWWPVKALSPCLYVGKATNLRRRFRQHLLSGTAGRAHQALSGNFKTKPRTSSCQLSFGIEHIFPAESNSLAFIADSVGFSWCDEFPDNAVAERFFAEDRLVGHFRPWFNIDSER